MMSIRSSDTLLSSAKSSPMKRNRKRRSKRYRDRSPSSAGRGGGSSRSYFRPNSSVYRDREKAQEVVRANNRVKRYERYLQNEASVGTYDLTPEADEKESRYGSVLTERTLVREASK